MSTYPNKNDEGVSSSQEGMSDKEYSFRHSIIKGRLAEILVEEMFLSMKYKVFRYGMENTIPGIMPLLKGVKSVVGEHIRRMPDLVIQDPETGKVHFIEVKFRANEIFNYEGLKAEYPYPNVFIIVVSKKHIKCLTVEQLKDGKCISPKCRNYLGSRKEFDLDK